MVVLRHVEPWWRETEGQEVLQCSPDYHEQAGALRMDGQLQGSVPAVPGGLHPPSSPVYPLLIPRPFHFLFSLYHLFLAF